MAITPTDLSKNALLNRYRGKDSADPPGLPIFNLNSLPTPTEDNRALFARDGDRMTLVVSRNGRWVDMMPRGDVPQQEIAHAGAVEGSTTLTAGARYTDRAAGGFRMYKDFYLGPLAAEGAAYHATFTGAGAALDDSTGWTRFLPNRTIRVRTGAGYTAGNITLDVELGQGFTFPIVIPAPAPSTTTYVQSAVHKIIRLRTAAVLPTGVTLNVETGPGFGVMPLPPFETNIGAYTVSVDGVVEVPTEVNNGSGTILPMSTPNGTRRYMVRWAMNWASHYAPPT